MAPFATKRDTHCTTGRRVAFSGAIHHKRDTPCKTGHRVAFSGAIHHKTRHTLPCGYVMPRVLRYSAILAKCPSTSVGPALWVAIARCVAPSACHFSA